MSCAADGTRKALQGIVWLALLPVLTTSWESQHFDLSATVVTLPAGQFKAHRVPLRSDGPKYFLRLRGVPYAQQPLGELRWQPPQPLPPPAAGRVQDATAFGPDCVQGPWYDRLLSVGVAGTSEGCLFLNVWAPEVSNASEAGKATSKLPVMFWIHGGAFFMGGSSSFDGDRVMAVEPNVVLVTCNYRLGALGFLGGDAVARSSRDGSAGNFGLQDTREALRWVLRNVEALGGDPNRVTIFGESAGASLVACHLVSPRSAGLFAGAIMESGAFDNYTLQRDPEANFRQFSRLAGCGDSGNDSSLACLRQLPVDSWWGKSLMPTISQTGYDGIFSAAVDGVELSASPEALASKGEINAVKGVMLGTNEDEGKLLMPLTQPVPGAPLTTAEQFRTWLQEQFTPDVVEQVVKQYTAADFDGSYWRAAEQVYTDSQYLCPTQRSASWLHKSGRAPSGNVFVYEFTYKNPKSIVLGKIFYWWEWCRSIGPCRNDTKIPFGTPHGTEIPLVWAGRWALDPQGVALSKKMIHYWHSFASNFDPNGNQADVQWPAYINRSQTVLLQPNITSVAGLRKPFCDFWQRVLHLPMRQPKARHRVEVQI